MQQLRTVRVPGVVWSALLVALAAFIQANFEGAVWYNIAMVVIAGALKGMDMSFDKVIPPVQGAARDLPPAVINDLYPEQEPAHSSTALRWLLG